MSRHSTYHKVFPDQYDTYLYFPVTKERVYVEDRIVPGKSAVVNGNTGKVIEIVGSTYKIVTHRDVVNRFTEAFEKIREDSRYRFSFADTFIERAGARMYQDWTGNDPINISGNLIHPIITIRNSYDKSLACSCDIVCVDRSGPRPIKLFSGIQLAFKHSINMSVDKLASNLTKAIDKLYEHEGVWSQWDSSENEYSTTELLIDSRKLAMLLGPLLGDKFSSHLNEMKIRSAVNKWTVFKAFCDTIFNEMNDKTRRASIISKARKIFYAS